MFKDFGSGQHKTGSGRFGNIIIPGVWPTKFIVFDLRNYYGSKLKAQYRQFGLVFYAETPHAAYGFNPKKSAVFIHSRLTELWLHVWTTSPRQFKTGWKMSRRRFHCAVNLSQRKPSC